MNSKDAMVIIKEYITDTDINSTVKEALHRASWVMSKDDRFTEKLGLYLGIVCTNTMSVNSVLFVINNEPSYLIATLLSIIAMIFGFVIYCFSNNEKQ